MVNNDTKRLSRLTAIIIQLQTKRLVTASALAVRFGVSIRTIYRDIRALEQSGVPVLTEEGKGYYLMEGYRIPPVTFTEREANALITAEQLVLQNSDSSFVKDYIEAIEKIKAVLRNNTKENADLLSSRIAVAQYVGKQHTSNHLASLQLALTNYNLTKLAYQKPDAEGTSIRIVEPFALLSTQGNWLLVAFCHLRKDFRNFRLDRMLKIEVQDEKFLPHKMTLQEYFQSNQK
jgi:predicted DNA-binding transcriptional regulator YafY